MTKSAVADWDTTAANNTDIGGINITGTGLISTSDDAHREFMAQIKAGVPYLSGTTVVLPSGATSGLQLESTDAGAGAGPLLTLYRNSASPAASDVIGEVVFAGEDSAGNTQTYGVIGATITDPTSTSEDGSLFWQLALAGTVTTVATLTPGALALAGTSSGPATLSLAEDTDNGTNKVTITPTASLTADRTVTLPDANLDLTALKANGAALLPKTAGGSAAMVRGQLYGLTLSNNGTDATNDIDIAAGEASDSTGADLMVLASALTKRLDASWAVGSGNGGLDTGSIANTTYHIWLIKRSDTGVVDALFSTSASSPTMPSNYDYKRRIGSIVRASSSIKGFLHNGDEFLWTVPAVDITASNPGTSEVARTLNLPTGIVVGALVSANIVQTDTTEAILSLYTIGTTYTLDIKAVDVTLIGGSQGRGGATLPPIRTNTSGQINSKVFAANASTTLYIVTMGYIDTRGRLA